MAANLSVLNQVIAVEDTRKKAATAELTDAYKVIQRGDAFGGMVREYDPKVDGEGLPSESKKVQVTPWGLIDALGPSIVQYWDLVATKEVGNSQAKADIEVDGQVIMEAVPVSFLLFLGKRLVDIRTFISKLPVLAQDKEWMFDPNGQVFRSETVETAREIKRPQVLLLAPATEQHPAQTQVYDEPVVVGTWSTTSLSSALPPAQVENALVQVDKLIEAVKVAREKANAHQVENQEIASALWDFIFAPIAPPAGA